ncbi:hypothetical protein LXL04_033027 [Taraxacum kok-saghyz]
MKERGKSVESDQQYNNFGSDYNFYYSSSSGVPCKKHPSSSPVGICAYCLKDRLMKLVCSDCGEQRRSSCSCSDVSSYRNSSCTVDVGSIGRISFLIENEKGGSGDEQKMLFSHMKQMKKRETEDDVILLKRSNSCVVEVKKSNGFWRIGKLFKKQLIFTAVVRVIVLSGKNRLRMAVVMPPQQKLLCLLRKIRPGS